MQWFDQKFFFLFCFCFFLYTQTNVDCDVICFYTTRGQKGPIAEILKYNNKVRQPPTWEQRISCWPSKIKKRLLYVNVVNPQWKTEVMPVQFHTRSTHQKRTSSQEAHGWIVLRGGVWGCAHTVKIQLMTWNHLCLWMLFFSARSIEGMFVWLYLVCFHI